MVNGWGAAHPASVQQGPPPTPRPLYMCGCTTFYCGCTPDVRGISLRSHAHQPHSPSQAFFGLSTESCVRFLSGCSELDSDTGSLINPSAFAALQAQKDAYMEQWRATLLEQQRTISTHAAQVVTRNSGPRSGFVIFNCSVCSIFACQQRCGGLE
eukprot:167758-Prorocentrum_minimum.AAC.1